MLRQHLEPRLYQQTIFNTAATKNTLVVLPTGMGKTMIAELLAAHRLQSYPGSKVVMLAPTRPLAQQHHDTFLRDLELKEEETAIFTGTVPPAKRQRLWQEARVIFSTPQGLENDILGSKIKLTEVSLLVFDEAHRATGDYSYVFIAERYRKQARNERILALTASPGSDKETIAEVCKNLFIEEVESRTGSSPDVQPYIQETEIEHVLVTMPEEFKVVHGALRRCYEQRLDALRTLGIGRGALVNKTMLLKLQGALHAEAARGQKSFTSLKAMSLLAEALKVEHAVELIETQGVAALSKYVEKLQADASRRQSKAVQNLVRDVNFKAALILLEKLKEREVEHPKLRALQKVVLRTLYAEKGSKIIIFNQFRDQAVRIKEAMDAIGVTSRIFVGQLKKGETGMSQKEQHAILEEFRSGGFSCLIATSVAEEGLDIPKVDLVIFYEPIPSAIRTVQRRGRTGRLEKGRIVVLVTEGTRDTVHRWAAHHKEKRMYRVIDEVRHEMRIGDFAAKAATINQFDEKQKEEESEGRKKETVAIIADHREKAGTVLKELTAHDEVRLELRQLDVGDYLLSDRVVVEYKTVKDFVDSIVDGRLLQQLRGLRSYQRPIIVIEGEEDLYGVRNVHPNAILGMLAAVTVSYNIPVLFTRSSRETAALLILIAKREQEHGKPDFQQHGQKPATDVELQEYIVSGLPHVGSVLAKELLSHLRTLQNIVNASEEELRKVPKVGEKKAKAIHDIVRKEYDPGK
jgi:ERCC4-related helicase